MRRICILCLAVAVLTACVTVPATQPPPTSTPTRTDSPAPPSPTRTATPTPPPTLTPTPPNTPKANATPTRTQRAARPTATKPATLPAMPGFQRELSLTNPPMTGDDVEQVQTRLLALGYTEVGPADGEYGSQTAAAVRHFQTDQELLADGIVGPITWAALFERQAVTPDATAKSKSAPTPAGNITRYPLNVRGMPMDVAFDGKNIWLLTDNSILMIDPATGNILQSLDSGFLIRTLLLVDKQVWFLSPNDAAPGFLINAFNADEQSIQTFPIAAPPDAVSACSMAFDGARLWIGWCKGTLQAYSLKAPGEVAESQAIANCKDIHRMVFDGARIWATDYDWLYAIDPNTYAVTQKLPLSSTGPLVFDGTQLWVSTGNELDMVNPATGQVTQAPFPLSIFSFDGTYVWGFDSHVNHVRKLEAPSGKTVSVYPLDDAPIAMASDGRRLWVIGFSGAVWWIEE